MSPIANTIHEPTRPRREPRVESRELDRLRARGREHALCFPERGCDGDGLGANVRKLPADEVGARAGGMFADVGAGVGGGGFHVGVVEAFKDIEVFVAGHLGDDVRLPGLGVRGLLPGVDGVEGEEGVGFVDGDEAVAVAAADEQPFVGAVGGGFERVEDVARPQHFETVLGKVGGEDAEEDVVLRQHDGVDVGAEDGPAGEGGEDGGLARGGGDAEDAIGGLSADLEVEAVRVASHGIGA